MSNTKGLFQDKKDLLKGIVKRASSIFPIFDLTSCDLIINFQNYWIWKRNIQVKFNIIIRSSNGTQVLKKSNNTPELINSISIKQLAIENNINIDKIKFGTVDLEIISEENLVYPFPAIMGYYISAEGFISCVHTAGRILEQNETKEIEFSETNFFLSLESKYRPFIHLFNGKDGRIHDIKIELNDGDSNYSKSIPSLEKPFESKIFFIDEHFDLKELNLNNKDRKIKSSFRCCIKGKSSNIFPRFIVGNYDTIKKYPAITHSFREIKEEENIKYFHKENSSTISLPLDVNDLNLEVFIYPTTSPKKTSVNLSKYKLENLEFISKVEKVNLSSKDGKIFKLKASEIAKPGIALIASSSLSEGKIPSRIPVGLMFSVKNKFKTLPTDIALQMRTHNAIPKVNYWFNGITNNQYRNIILGSSFTGFKNYCDLLFDFELSIKNNKKKLKKIFHYNPKNSKTFCINLNEMIYSLFVDSLVNNQIISYCWRINIKKGSIQDLYCLSYSEKTGCIFGDHSF